MHRSIKRTIIFIVCLLNFSSQYNCIANTERAITPAQWQQLKEDKAFDYKNDREHVKKQEHHNPGPLIKFFREFFEFFGGNFGKALMWLIIICIACYAIYKLFFTSDSFLFGKNKKVMTDTGQQQQEEENLITTNWEALVQHAISSNDARLTVRYSYMWLLQMLLQQQLIQYRNDKTNYEYYSELKDTQYRQPFKRISSLYEYAWYGHFNLTQDALNEYLKLIGNVKGSLKA